MKYMKPKFSLGGGYAFAFGLIVAAIIVSAGTALLSWFIFNGNTELQETTLISYAVIYLSVLVGSLIAVRGGGGYIAVRAIIFCSLYFLVQLGIGVVLLDCSNLNVWMEILIVLLAGATACAICITKIGRKRRRKKVIR